jgi:hypothetical protein
MRRFVLPIVIVLAFVVSALLAIPARQTAAAGVGAWQVAAPMSHARIAGALVALRSGSVLAIGGTGDGATILANTEIYDPGPDQWTAAAAMSTPRANFTATLLRDGRVLVVGGTDASSTLASAELYDPTNNTWKPAGTMTDARYGQAAVLLHDGRVLVVGGTGISGALASTELYDPSSNSWTLAASMSAHRAGTTAVVMADGRVLVAGGTTGATVESSAEIYDPTSNTWQSAAPMANARAYHVGALLPDGRVLEAGGFVQSAAIASSETYNPVSNTWTTVGSLATARGNALTEVLPDGHVLAVGGADSNGADANSLASAELFDPVSNTWTGAGVMRNARNDAAIAMLSNGTVVVAGGVEGITYLDSVDIYVPALVPTATVTPTPAPATSTPPPNNTATPTSTAVQATASSTDTPTPGVTNTPVATDTVTKTATPTLTTVPTKAKFTIVAVRAENNSGKPDWQFQQAPLNRVAVGTTLQLSSYTELQVLPAGSHLSIQSRVYRGNSMVHQSGFADHVGPNGIGGLWQHTTYTPSVTGAYRLTVSVTIGSVMHSLTSSFTVTAPPIPPFRFTFTGLTLLDHSGKTVTTARPAERITVHATWQTSPATTPINVILTESLQYKVGSAWKPLGAPLQTAFQAASGNRFYNFSFVPGGNHPSLRVVISLSVNGKVQQRSVVLHLQG